MQLLTVIDPRLKQLRKEGEQRYEGLITKYTRWGTVFLATFQAIGVCIALEGQGVVMDPGLGIPYHCGKQFVTGTMFLMWLGEQITERGVGNGISMIIFAGIVAGLPSAVAGTLELSRTGELHLFGVFILFALAIVVTGIVVFIERGQRRISINYPKRQVGKKMYAGQSSHLPLKLNMAGVIPPIFASSIILFPATLTGWIAQGDNTQWLQDIVTNHLSPGQLTYVLLYAAAIIFFCFFYTAMMFDPRETADNLKKQGAFIPGMRPGEQTAKYLDGVLTRLTLGRCNVYITAICLLPEFLILQFNVPFYFGGTSLLNYCCCRNGFYVTDAGTS